jgi:hypothetical protein
MTKEFHTTGKNTISLTANLVLFAALIFAIQLLSPSGVPEGIHVCVARAARLLAPLMAATARGDKRGTYETGN